MRSHAFVAAVVNFVDQHEGLGKFRSEAACGVMCHAANLPKVVDSYGSVALKNSVEQQVVEHVQEVYKIGDVYAGRRNSFDGLALGLGITRTEEFFPVNACNLRVELFESVSDSARRSH